MGSAGAAMERLMVQSGLWGVGKSEKAADKEVLPVKVGLGVLDRPMTRGQAQKWGEKNMPADLKRAGFKVVVFRSDAEINGSNFFRVNYGYGGSL